jgi:hypothetical protein
VGRETHHDGVVGSNSVFITLGLEGLLEDEVAIGVIDNHHILVARPGLDWETSGVLCIKLADGDDMDVDFVGQELWFFGGNCWKKWGRVERGGAWSSRYSGISVQGGQGWSRPHPGSSTPRWSR